MKDGVSAAVFMLDEIETTEDVIEELEQVEQVSEIILVTPCKEAASRFSKYQNLRIILEEKREGKTKAVQRAIDATDKKYLLHVTGDSKIKAADIEKMIDMITARHQGAVVSQVEVLNNRRTIMGKVNVLLWGMYDEVNWFLSSVSKAKTGDVFIFQKNLVPVLPKAIINDDAYIDGVIDRQNMGIIQSSAVAKISGPYSPRDYIIQRSRIAQGHFQLIFEHGIIPNSLVFSRHLPLAVRVRLLVNVLRANKEAAIGFPVFLFLEGLSVLIGFVNMATGKQGNVWTQVKKDTFKNLQ